MKSSSETSHWYIECDKIGFLHSVYYCLVIRRYHINPSQLDLVNWERGLDLRSFCQNIFTRALGDTLFWGHFNDHKHTISSKMPWKPIIESNKQLAEYLKSSEEIFCEITKEISVGVMEDNASIYNETYRILERSQKIRESLDSLIKTFKASFEYHERNYALNSVTLQEKSDRPNDAAELKRASNSASLQTVHPQRLDANDEERFAADPLLECQELCTKVEKNAKETSLTVRGKQTTDYVTLVMLKVVRKEGQSRNDHEFVLCSCGKLNSPFSPKLIIFASVILSGNAQITLVCRKFNSFSSNLVCKRTHCCFAYINRETWRVLCLVIFKIIRDELL